MKRNARLLRQAFKQLYKLDNEVDEPQLRQEWADYIIQLQDNFWYYWWRGIDRYHARDREHSVRSQ